MHVLYLLADQQSFGLAMSQSTVSRGLADFRPCWLCLAQVMSLIPRRKVSCQSAQASPFGLESGRSENTIVDRAILIYYHHKMSRVRSNNSSFDIWKRSSCAVEHWTPRSEGEPCLGTARVSLYCLKRSISSAVLYMISHTDRGAKPSGV